MNRLTVANCPGRRGRIFFGTSVKRLNWQWPVVICLLLTLQVTAQTPVGQDSLMNLRLFKEIRAGDAAKVEALLKAGASPNAQSGDYSALMAAALNGTAATMKILIDHGANINYFNKDSISAIWLAVPDREKTTLLISSGANVQQRSREGNTVLVKLASIPGSADLIQSLIMAGCNPLKCGVANDVMFNAAGSGDTAIVALFIRNGLSVNDSCSFGDYPINSALGYRSFNVLKMLVENGANVNAHPEHGILPLFIGITPLMWAAVSNDKPSFYYLLAHGADAKAKSPGGYNTLMFLAKSEADDPEMTKALIDRGVVPSDKALDETDALYHFRLRGSTKSVDMLASHAKK